MSGSAGEIAPTPCTSGVRHPTMAWCRGSSLKANTEIGTSTSMSRTETSTRHVTPGGGPTASTRRAGAPRRCTSPIGGSCTRRRSRSPRSSARRTPADAASPEGPRSVSPGPSSPVGASGHSPPSGGGTSRSTRADSPPSQHPASTVRRPVPGPHVTAQAGSFVGNAVSTRMSAPIQSGNSSSARPSRGSRLQTKSSVDRSPTDATATVRSCHAGRPRGQAGTDCAWWAMIAGYSAVASRTSASCSAPRALRVPER